MSEPQHPQTEGTQTSTGQPGAAAAGRNGVPGPFDSLAAAGARLAQLREAKGWSVDDVSSRLKVPAPKLRALEAGDISHLPGTTFALGVVRSYAKLLGVDATPFTNALRREKGEPEPDLSMPASTGTDLPRGRVSVSLGGTPRHRSWWWGVAAVVVALAALVMWHGGGEPPAWLARLKASANGAAANSSGPSTVAQTVASGATAGPGNEPQAVSPPAEQGSADTGAAQAEPASAPALTTASATMPAAARAEQVPPASVSAAPAVATASAASAPAGGGAGSTVALKVSQDSWFSVRDKNGKELFSGIVRAGEMKEVRGEQPFKVVAGNRAGLDSVTLDGQSVDPARYDAGKGNVSRFSLP
ncbi:RodZ domain-containing protein [Trinickia caryophylli]|uniref:Cytoskeleton protein RodZ n=1 Tax=Trinickia caryophylli TaxID=28094 RepID=A0A1X7FXL0_TRICW|nr:RodZ domain-containing protein [Trinickia caryophylli]PMS11719.1 DUF4115 domain-containing protein [Trinickia caryophylli]TRX17397.1 helix-turn-helix domain-containing protein [Trinickia caryophylli]WQE11860.1 DUF4115 domain-containing protein [Trinickia caryophylli]SMF60487.1 cytoskeleton protein RodZ [Trinickia caryophylli]GLU34636.1 XRE family transcriptional regulator [Trinickia caryophylli]